MDTTVASNFIALGLGLLSVAIALLPEQRRWRTSRHAGVSLSLENYQRPDSGQMQARFIIVNAGPAAARNVTIESFDSFDVNQWSPVNDNAHPARVVQPGQRHAILWDQLQSQRTPGSAVLSWADDAGQHRQEFSVSPIYL